MKLYALLKGLLRFPNNCFFISKITVLVSLNLVKSMEIKILHLIISLFLASVYIFYCHYCLSPYYSMDILHMNCYYPLLYLSPKMLNIHYPLLIIIEKYLYSILLRKCLIMLLLNYLPAVFKLPICNLLIKQNIPQHYAPWLILRLCIIMLTMVVTCIAVDYYFII